MVVYQSTPHNTIGKTPAFFLMGCYLRTKLPQLSQPVHGDKETRDRDQAMKFTSKQYSDAKRNPRTSDVKADDSVLLKRVKKNKLSACLFATQLCKVQDKKGNQVIISDRKNPERVFHRNTTEVKRYDSSDEQTSNMKAQLKQDYTPAVAEKNMSDVDPKSGDALSHLSHSEVESRYPQRICKPPDGLNHYVHYYKLILQ